MGHRRNADRIILFDETKHFGDSPPRCGVILNLIQKPRENVFKN